MDNIDLRVAQVLPVSFTRFRQWGPTPGAVEDVDIDIGIPAERTIVSPL
jgi:hypothetical protein